MTDGVTDDVTRGQAACARAWAERGRAAEQRGHAGEAVACYDEALELLHVCPPDELVPDVLRWKGTARREVGDTRGADVLYRRSLKIAEAISYAAGIAHALNCLAVLAQRRGDMERARQLYGAAALRAVAAGDDRLAGMIEQNLGVIAGVQGEVDDALLRFRMSIQSFERAGDAVAVSWVLNNLGLLYAECRQFDEAARWFDRALASARAHGDPRVEGVVEGNRAEMLIADGAWEAAEAPCARSLLIAEERGDSLRVGEALKLRAMLERKRDHFERATTTLEEALTLARGGQDALLSAEVLCELGETWRLRGERNRAREAWQAAIEGFRKIGAGARAGEIVDCLGRLAA